MDWQERLRRNRERIAQENSEWSGISSQLDAGGFQKAVPQAEPEKEEDPGFLGSILDNVGDAAKGVYNFGKGIVDSVVDSATDAFGGVSDVIAGQIASGQVNENTKELNRVNQEHGAYLDTLSYDDFDKPEVKQKLKEFEDKKEAIMDRNDAPNAAIEKSNKVDATKTAAAAADTFLNVATAGVGGIAKNVAKGAVTQGAKVVGRNAVQNAARLGTRGAASRLGHMAFEGGTIGAAQGALDPVRREGSAADWRDIATSGLIGGALGGTLSPAIGGIVDGQVRREIPGMLRAGRDATREGASNLAAGYGRMTSGYSPGYITPEGLGLGRFADDAAEEGADRFDLADIPFGDDTITPTTRATADGTTEAADTINLNKMSTARREKIIQQLNNDQPIGLDNFNPAEKRIIRQELDNVIAQDNPEIANHMMNPLDGSEFDRAEGSIEFPKMTKNEVINFFGSMDGFPIRNLVKEKSGQRGVDLQAMDAGFDDVEQYLDAVRSKMNAVRGAKEMDALLRDARKDPEFINQAVRRLVSEDAVDRTRGPYMSRGQQGYTPARVVEARNNNAMDYTGSYRDERPERLSQITSSIYGEAPAPRVAANPVEPATPLPQWYRDTLFGQDPGRPQMQLGSGLPDPIPTQRVAQFSPDGTVRMVEREAPVNLNRTQLKRMSRDGTLPENYTIGAKPSSATPTIVDSTGRAGAPKQFKDDWNMDDARAALGGQEPLLGDNGKPVQFRGQPIPKADEDALREIMELGNLNGAGNFKDINGMIDDITRNMEGGRLDSKGAELLDRVYNTIGHQSGAEARAVSSWRDEVAELNKRFTFDKKETEAANQWLQAGKNKAQAEANIRKELGDAAFEKISGFFEEAKPRLKRFIDGYNNEMIANGLPDRVIKGLDPEDYFPRIYANPSITDKVMDTLGGGGGTVDTRHAGIANNGFDPNNMSGTTTRTDMALPNAPRAAGQAPIGSADNRPNSGFNSFAQHRTANSAQGPMVNPLEALSKYGEVMVQQTNRVRAVTEIRRLEKIAKTLQEKTGDNRITPIVNAFTNSANALTGKTNVLDRGFIDTVGGQRMMRVMGTISKSLSRSQLLGSASTVAAQTGQLPLMISKLGPENYAKGIKLMTDTKRFEKYLEKSNFLARNFPENKSQFSGKKIQQAIEKGSRITGKPMEFTAEMMAKTSYAGAIEDGLAKNLSGQKLIDYADRIAAGINADRVAGLRANAYESRVLQPIVMYTQDVNQMYQSAKRFVGEKNYKAIGTLLAATYAYNLGYEQLTGNKLIADPISAATDVGRTLTDQGLVDDNGDPLGMGERVIRSVGRLGGEAAAATPLGNAVVGALYPERGLRMPFGGGERFMSRADVFGNSQVGRFGGSMPITSAFENPLYLLGIPGASQLQKSYEGISAYNEGASVSPSGTERFTIEQTPENLIRSLIYGPYQTAEGRAYIQDRNDRLQGFTIQ